MKRLSLFFIILIVTCATSAQVTTENYIRTRTMLNTTGNSYMDNIAYYDGLGRPYQTVQKSVKEGAQTGSILATMQEYDSATREYTSWLPIVISSDYVDAATFKSGAPGNYNSDSRPYSQPIYEASPLNRALQQYGPGAAWYGNHPVATEYLANTTSAPLNCINYSVDNTGALVNSGNCAADQLNVVKVTDEDGNISYTFTDKLERTRLTRQMKGNEANDTYYVYDDLDNLRFVLQPMYQSSPNLDQYAFQYKYDGRNHCIWKKLPGVQYAEYVYDNANRLIFSQNGNQRISGKWTFYVYDNLNRLTKQGECTGQDPSSYDAVIYIQNYYDDYTFRSQTGFNNSNFADGGTTGKGYLTGSITTVLGSSDKIYSTNYYDIKGRITGTVHNNLLGGYETTSTAYTFTDKPAQTVRTHTTSEKDTCTEIYDYTYDQADRVSKVEHTLNGVKVTLVDNTYDSLGHLSTKSLHGSPTNKLTYTYNIRNWLTSIAGTPFSQNLYYNSGTGTACYNGNISSMTWRNSDAVTRGYKFSYDGLKRIQTATYGETSTINTNLNRFTECVTSYDKNGNILGLQRYGQTGINTYGIIDNLSMSVDGNQLTEVNDAATASTYNGSFEFRNGASTFAELAYDANGNVTKDLNKNITNIQYNSLNLPKLITFSDGNTITYLYGANGTKLRTAHKIGSVTITTYYCDNVIYESGIAMRLLTGPGYVSLSDNKYHYYLQDHEGNNRVVVDQNGNVEETNNYYPFGGVFASTGNVQPYKYNGKEFDSKKGLNWYDYGARHYDAALGRFMTVDPMAEKYYPTSLYGYCLNNPIKFIDPTGQDVDEKDPPRGGFLPDYWSPRLDKLKRLATLVTETNLAGGMVFKGSGISYSASAWAIKGKAGIGPIKGEVGIGVGNFSIKTKGENASAKSSLIEADAKLAVKSISSKFNASFAEETLTLGKDINTKADFKWGSAKAGIQIGNDSNVKIDHNATITAGVKFGVVQADLSVNFKAATQWVVGTINTIVEFLTPELSVQSWIDRNKQ